MLPASSFRWLPSSITAIRALCCVPVVILAVQDMWVACFWLFILALLTDFLDGFAAKKLNAQTRFGADLDRFTDVATVVAGFLGLVLSGIFPLWLGLLFLAAGLMVGGHWFFWPKDRVGSGLRTLFSVVCLFIAWITIAWAFAVQAIGWSWTYVPITVGIMTTLTCLKRHRIVTWLNS